MQVQERPLDPGGPRIRLLDEATVLRIASGEVVERPASVVKELVENSLDANAKRVDIDVRGQMPLTISVVDDGEGIRSGDVELAVQRHATSKIASAEDIIGVASLGFRGEALASIAAVSRMTIRTRTRESPDGTILTAAAGKVDEVRPAGSPCGTSVTVSDLFFPTPARFKFLKSPAWERARITETVIRLAISRPDVSFVLRFDGSTAVVTGGGQDMASVVAGVWGAELARRLVVVRGGGRPRVAGLAGPPDLARGDRSRQCFVVNGRVVESRTLASAVAAAYQDLVPKGRYPVAVLALSCEPGTLDVNVHPAKLEVKFAEESGVFTAVRSALREAVSGAAPAPAYPSRPASGSPAWSSSTVVRDSAVLPPPPPLPWARPVSTGRDELAGPGWRFLGAFGGMFLAFEDEHGGLAIVDQHAAHERVIYEKVSAAAGAGSAGPGTPGPGGSGTPGPAAVELQHLLVPQVFQVSPEAAARLESGHIEALRELGVGVERFGRQGYSTFRLVHVPAWAADRPEVFSGPGMEAVVSDERLPGETTRTRLCAALACGSAVRDGDPMSGPEAEALLRDLRACSFPMVCPHGRPTVYRISPSELRRAFKRA